MRDYVRKSPHNLVRHRCCCHYCGNGFNSSRPDAVYCSPKCRSAAARERKRRAERQRFIELVKADTLPVWPPELADEHNAGKPSR